MAKGRNITVSAPGKLHLLGEHSVVYGRPAILTSLDLRVKVRVSQGRTIPSEFKKLQKLIDKLVKKELKLKKVPLYSLEISSEIPLGSGLGSSAAISACYIAALLTYLRVNWDLELIYKLTFEAEKVFQGNPSGGDQASVIYGGLIWFRKEAPDLKLIHPLKFTIPNKLSKKFILINTGRPKEITADMVNLVRQLYDKKPKLVEKILNDQERLVKELLPVLKEPNHKEFIRIIRHGEKNLETLGVVSKAVLPIIRAIEKRGGAAKIIGAGGKETSSGMLLAYHKDKKVVERIAKSYNLPYFQAKLGVEGLRKEK